MPYRNGKHCGLVRSSPGDPKGKRQEPPPYIKEVPVCVREQTARPNAAVTLSYHQALDIHFDNLYVPPLQHCPEKRTNKFQKEPNMKIALLATVLAAYIAGTNAIIVVACNQTLVDEANCMQDCGCGCTQPPLTPDLNCNGGANCNSLMGCLNNCFCVAAGG